MTFVVLYSSSNLYCCPCCCHYSQSPCDFRHKQAGKLLLFSTRQVVTFPAVQLCCYCIWPTPDYIMFVTGEYACQWVIGSTVVNGQESILW